MPEGEDPSDGRAEEGAHVELVGELQMQKRSYRHRVLFPVALAALLAAGCSPTTPGDAPAATATQAPVTALTPAVSETAAAPEVSHSATPPSEGAATGTPSAGALVPQLQGVEITVVKPGSGEALASGQVGSFHYTGWLEGFEKGEPFDSSRSRGPFNTVIGREQVIPAWDQGLVGMQPGEVRRLVVSPEMGYGEGGAGPIPPNATLYFDVEYLGPGQ